MNECSDRILLTIPSMPKAFSVFKQKKIKFHQVYCIFFGKPSNVYVSSFWIIHSTFWDISTWACENVIFLLRPIYIVSFFSWRQNKKCQVSNLKFSSLSLFSYYLIIITQSDLWIRGKLVVKTLHETIMFCHILVSSSVLFNFFSFWKSPFLYY